MIKSLGFLGLAEKSGRLCIGEEACKASVRDRKAKIICFASDSSKNTADKARNLAETGGIRWVVLPYGKDDIGRALGKSATGLFTITDIGFAGGFLRKLAAEVPGKYEETAEMLEKKAESIRRSAGNAARRKKK